MEQDNEVDWEREFDKFEYSPITPAAVIREQLEWYKENGRDHGDFVLSEELITATIKDFIRETLATQKSHAYQEGYKEGQKHAFGVDKERVRAEVKSQIIAEVENMSHEAIGVNGIRTMVVDTDAVITKLKGM